MGKRVNGVWVREKWDDLSALELLNLLVDGVNVNYDIYSALYDRIKGLEPAKAGQVKYYLGFPLDENKHKRICGPHKVAYVKGAKKVWFEDGGKCVPGSQVYDSPEEAEEGLKQWIEAYEFRKAAKLAERAEKEKLKAEEAAKKAAEAEKQRVLKEIAKEEEKNKNK